MKKDVRVLALVNAGAICQEDMAKQLKIITNALATKSTLLINGTILGKRKSCI